MPSIVDMTGTVVGRLTVMSFAGINSHHHATWLCRCICGKTTTVTRSALRERRSRSCGCLRAEIATERATRHGAYGSPTHQSWSAMHARCREKNPNDKRFTCYVARGIKVCRRWRSFENFLEDMGPRPRGKSIDRIDNDRGYYPRNCRWATRHQQRMNQRGM